MKSPAVSIIVPVYKVEKYLAKCIDSILAQTYTDFELLLIDDGSPDRSGAICDEYAARDSRVCVLHKTNGGVSSARNTGLENASGEWIMFVDADDWIEDDTIMYCLTKYASYDIIRFAVKSVFDEEEKNIEMFNLPKGWTRDTLLQHLLCRDTVLGCIGTLYKRTLFQSPYPITFDTSLIMGEDWQVLVKAVFKSKTAITVNQPFYCYNQLNVNSCTHAESFLKALDCHKVYLSFVELLNSEKKYENFLIETFALVYKSCVSLLIKESHTSSDFDYSYCKYVSKFSIPTFKQILRSDLQLSEKMTLLLSRYSSGRKLIHILYHNIILKFR